MTRQSGVRGGRLRRAGCLVAWGVGAFLPMAGLAVRADAAEAFRCELTESRGVSPADAATAGELVCSELRRASGGRGRFGVALATLGRLVVVTATREEPAGSVSVQVDGVEEVPTAAPRIADALVHGLGFATTQRVDNLLEGETRPVLAKKGSVKFSFGVADVESLGHGARASGFSLGLMYAAPRFALPAEMRFAWDDAREGEAGLHLFSISVGGRGYLSKRDVSPFVGGGLGLLSLDADDGDFYGANPDYFYGERRGIAPYVEAGVEMLRLHRARVAFLVRADFPTGALRSEVWSYDDGVGVPSGVQSRYVVPVTIGVNVAF
jgi:hypothetical protein